MMMRTVALAALVAGLGLVAQSAFAEDRDTGRFDRDRPATMDRDHGRMDRDDSNQAQAPRRDSGNSNGINAIDRDRGRDRAYDRRHDGDDMRR